MPTMLIPEIFEKAGEATKKEEKQNILRSNRTPALMTILYMTYHPSIKFSTKVPTYKKEDVPTGMAMNSLYAEAKRLYIWRADYTLDQRRKDQLLVQMLESLDAKEAELVEQIFKKKLKYKGLTYNFIAETFPELNLPKEV
jgi:hypothetical protein